MSDDVTDFGQNIHGATVRVPAGNGLGVALDEEKLKKYQGLCEDLRFAQVGRVWGPSR